MNYNIFHFPGKGNAVLSYVSVQVFILNLFFKLSEKVVGGFFLLRGSMIILPALFSLQCLLVLILIKIIVLLLDKPIGK